MFELEGDQFDLSAIEKFAKDDNKTVEEYISTYGLTEVEPGKTTPTAPGAVVEETAAPKSQNTESTSENTFSDLQSPDNQYDFADLEFTNSLLDPSADKFEVIKNRYFMNTADVMKGATTQAKKEAKESQISNLNKKFKEGEFKKDEKLAFLDFQKTGKINPDLLPDPYIRKINPDTLEPYTGEEILNNVFENFKPALMSQLEAIKASSIDWLSKAAGPDAADFIVNPDLGKGGIEKENNKYYYKLDDGSKQEIGVEATNKQKNITIN
jgi:hypothetical protein